MKMRGGYDLSTAMRMAGGILLVAIMISILNFSVGAKDEEPATMEDDLVRVTIGDFFKDNFFIKYGEEKKIPLKNSIEVYVRPADVVLLLDISSSMNNFPSEETERGEKRIEILKRIAAHIISEASSNSRIAIVAFGAKDSPKVEFTDKKSPDLQNTIDNLEAEGCESKAGKKLGEAIAMASADENPCTVVMITDCVEVGGGIYRFTDYIGRAKLGEIPIFCALINPDIRHEEEVEELEEEIEETHGALTFIGGGPGIKSFTEKIEEVFGGYALRDFVIQLIPSPTIDNVVVSIIQGNVLSPEISDSTVQITEFSPDTLRLSIESTADVEQYSGPSGVVPYSVLITYTDPLLKKEVILPEIKTKSVSFEFEGFIPHFRLHIMISILGAVAMMGVVVTWKYSRHQRREIAGDLIKLSRRHEKNNELKKAFESLQNAIALLSQLGDSAEKHEAHLENLKKKMNTIEEKKGKIIKILTRARKNLKKAMQILRTERYLEQFFPSFNELKPALNAQNITDSILVTAIESIKLENDQETLDEHLSSFEHFAEESDSEFLALGRAQDLYENENSRELITLLLEQRSRLGIDDLSKNFFEDMEVARLLLNLWKLNNPDKKGEFNEFISSEEKEGYENLASLKQMQEGISRKLDTVHEETLTAVLKDIEDILVNIGRAYELSQKTLQEFSSKYEETHDPTYETVVYACKEIQKDLVQKKDDTESLKRSVEKEIELKIGTSRDELEKLKVQITKGDYRDEVISALYRLQTKLQSVGMADMLNETHRVTSDLERKVAIIELLNNTKVMSIRNLCENMGIYSNKKGKRMIMDLCRQIIKEKNRRHDVIPQYQLFTENDPEIFLDFNLLAKYTLEVGKAPSEIETDFGETLLLPREVHTDLINVLKQGGGGRSA
jgi:hypothetical protein